MEIELLRPFEIAQKLSHLSEFDQRFKMSAVIMRRGRIIGMGYNKLKTQGAKYPNLFSCHAEIVAIINSKPYKNDLRGTDIYIYRETVDKIPAMARPCNTCYGAILESGISRIFYSINTYPYYEIIQL